MPINVMPQPEFGRLPGPHSTYQPAPSRRNGNSQRPVSNQGAIESRHQSVSVPSPGSASAISVTEPSTRSTIPTIERATSGFTERIENGPLRRRLRVVVAGFRRVATSDLDHDREDHR